MAAQRELARIRHMKNKPKDKLPDERFFSIFLFKNRDGQCSISSKNTVTVLLY